MHEEVEIFLGLNGHFGSSLEQRLLLELHQDGTHFGMVFLELFARTLALHQQSPDHRLAPQVLHAKPVDIDLESLLLYFPLQELLVLGFEDQVCEDVSVFVDGHRLFGEIQSQGARHLVVARSHDGEHSVENIEDVVSVVLLVVFEALEFLDDVFEFEDFFEQKLSEHEFFQAFRHELPDYFQRAPLDMEFGFEEKYPREGVYDVLGLQRLFLPQSGEELVFDVVLKESGPLLHLHPPNDLHVNFYEILLESVDQDEAEDDRKPVQHEENLLGPPHLVLLCYKALFKLHCFVGCPVCRE